MVVAGRLGDFVRWSHIGCCIARFVSSFSLIIAERKAAVSAFGTGTGLAPEQSPTRAALGGVRRAPG